MSKRYLYPTCEVIRWVDGDTVELRPFDADWGLGTEPTARARFRLARINATELDDPGGPEALHYVRGRFPGRKEFDTDTEGLPTWYRRLGYWPGSIVAAQTFKQGRYGRWVAELWPSPSKIATDTTISDDLVQVGFAVYKTYRRNMPGVPWTESPHYITPDQRAVLADVYGWPVD
jgi:endonuclease YncB( thermonuclease family)